VRVYCNSCWAWYDPRKEKGKVRKKKCSHPPGKQCYKSTIDEPMLNGERQRRSLTYETRNLKELIVKALEYKINVKELAVAKAKECKPEKPTLLIDCLAMYLDFKNDIGVEDHANRDLSQGTLTEFKNHITKWRDATVIAGENFAKLRVDNISKKNVAATIKYLGNWSNSTQTKVFGFYNQFYKYLNENGYNIKSPFKGIEVSNETKTEARAVTYKEFLDVVEVMSNGTSDDKLRGRRIYFDWLPEAMHFAALTGRRIKHEFMDAKFSDIELIDGELLGGFIWILDSKYSKQNKHKIGFQPRYTKAPVYQELYDFLMEMGYKDHKDSDRYIVAGDEKKQRDTLANNLTNAFGFYRNKIGMSKKVQLKGLRKKFVTRMRNEFGDNANFFTGHKSSRIDSLHYYDDRELFEKVKEFRLWKR